MGWQHVQFCGPAKDQSAAGGQCRSIGDPRTGSRRRVWTWVPQCNPGVERQHASLAVWYCGL